MTKSGLGMVYEAMLEYQKVNGVEDECIANAQYFYDTYTQNNPHSPAKIQAVICLDLQDEYSNFIIHVVVELEGRKLVDPSYDVTSVKGMRYYDSIHSLMNSVILDKERKRSLLAKIIPEFLEFVEFARRMNEGEIVIADRTHYDKQADYIEQTLGHIFIPGTGSGCRKST